MHPDVDQIADLAFGEVEGAERALLMRHIASCDECREELETATLLVEANDRGLLGSESHVQARRIRYYAAAAAIGVLALGWFAIRPYLPAAGGPRADFRAAVESEEDIQRGEGGERVVTESPELPPGIPDTTRYVRMSTDDGLRTEVLQSARFRYPDATVRTGFDVRAVVRAIDAFEAGDFDAAAAELAMEPSLPQDARALMGAFFFFGGWPDQARAAFEEVLGEILLLTERPVDSWGSAPNMALYFLARIHEADGNTPEAVRLARLAAPGLDNWAVASEILLARQ